MLRFLTFLLPVTVGAAGAHGAGLPQPPLSAPVADLWYQTILGVSPVSLPGKHLDELEAFVDETIGRHLESGIAGAAVAVVKDGRVHLCKGYGFADLKAKTLVDPTQTVFRAGSISKLFTATAVMQLVEREVSPLSLNVDVNDYLDGRWRVPDTFPGLPITLKHLLTHTAGLESNTFGFMGAPGPADEPARALGTTLAAHIPARVRPPGMDFGRGAASAYSNWGAALAGHVVEIQSGLPFSRYVQQRIFGPLKMARSTFEEPLPRHLLSAAAIGYTYRDFGFEARNFEYYHGVAPAGALSTTADDMARFMITHLQAGAYEGERILKAQSADLMQSRVLSPNPFVNGSGLGFIETWINGHRVIGHPGKTAHFYADLALVPAQGLGVFVIYNTMPAPDVTGAFVREFMDRYLPAQLPKVEPPPDFGARAPRYLGSYAPAPRSHSTAEKLLAAVQAIQVTATQRNTLVTSNLRGRGPEEWVEVRKDEGVFRRAKGDEMIAFVANDVGEVAHLLGPTAFVPWSRLAWYQGPGFNGLILVVLVVAFFAAVVAAPVRAGLGAHAGARWLLAGTGLVNLLTLAALAGFMLSLKDDLASAMVRVPWQLWAAEILALASVLATLAVLRSAFRAWRDEGWTLYGRIEYSVLALLALGFDVWLYHWNLIGFMHA